ncbi:MAG: UvrB/UvrC motif-containing protein [Dethiobacteria bacterium]
MICQECQQETATVHITKIINGRKTELHLCHRCAQAHDELDFSFEPQFSLHNLLGSMLGESMRGSREALRKAKVQCPSCALTFAQFSQIGRLGCSHCFSAFDEQLAPLLRRIHGSSRHTGKVPRRRKGSLRSVRELERLREELKLMIQKEEFEKAAELRDRIKALEKEMKEGE